MLILGIETSCDETSAAVVEETGDARGPGRSARTSSRRRWRFIASGAASFPNSRRVSTSATSAASSSARWTTRMRAGAISARWPSRRGPGSSDRCSSASRSRSPRRSRPDCRSSASTTWPATSSRSCCRTASCRCPPSCSSCRAVTRASTWSNARATISSSAARETMRPGGVRQGGEAARPRLSGWSGHRSARAGRNDRAIPLPTTRLTHADRNAPELKGDLDFSFSGLKTAVLRHVREREADGRGPLTERRSATSAPPFSGSSSPRSSIARSPPRAASARRASASPAACRRTAGCGPI